MADLNKNILILDLNAIRYKELLASLFPGVTFHSATPDEDFSGFIAKAHAIFALEHFFNDTLLEQAQALEWAQALTTGYGTVLACKALKPDVILTNTRGIHGPQVSELAFLHMIALSRNYPHMLRNQDRAIWQRWPQSLIYGKTAAILGIGAIAGELAPRLKAFGMKVIGISSTKREVPGFDRMVGRDRMCEVLGEADYFIVLIPYSQASDKIVNADVLAAMKPEAYLINLARGGVVDEDALLDALRNKKIAGAGLDVFKDRVLPADHAFWSMENVLITPMIGGMSDIYEEQALPILETNLRAFINGDTESMINVIERQE